MGCVQSDQYDRRERRHSRDQRYHPQHHQQRPQQQQHRHQQQQHNQRQPHHQNGHAKQVSRSNPRDKNLDDHLYENVDKDPIIAKTSTTKSPIDDADTQFRRQHFDRNSCLRHSKKRKKSSSTSNPNSPAVLNGTTTKISSATTPVAATTPVTTATVTTTIVSNSRTGKTNSVENSPTNNNRLVNINGKSSSTDDVFKFDETEIVDIDEAIAQDSDDDELRNDHELQKQLEEEEQRYQQQLLQEKRRQQQQHLLQQEQLRQQQQQQDRQLQQQQKQRSKSSVDPPAKKISTNSVSNLPRLSAPKEGLPPLKVVQQRAPKISSGDRPVSQTRPENGQTRMVLRTRRQVEEEQRNGGRGKDEEPIDDSEDCGRLI